MRQLREMSLESPRVPRRERRKKGLVSTAGSPAQSMSSEPGGTTNPEETISAAQSLLARLQSEGVSNAGRLGPGVILIADHSGPFVVFVSEYVGNGSFCTASTQSTS